MSTIKSKKCETCDKEIIRYGGVYSDIQWKLKRFCSRKCHAPHHSKVMKGKMGTKGYKHTDESKKKMSISKLKNNKRFWKGSPNEYRQIHIWVEKHLGKPDTCEECGKTGLSGKKIHWANISHEYRREVSDWKRLCAQCHCDFDKHYWQENKLVL